MDKRLKVAGALFLVSVVGITSVHREGSPIAGWSPYALGGSAEFVTPTPAVSLTASPRAEAPTAASRDEPYNFRKSEAYRALSGEDRRMLDQVHRDMVLLWGALDMYADDHNGKAPEKLEDLVPIYLDSLPIDPFAGRRALLADAQLEDPLPGYRSSLSGIGYFYRQGRGRSWIVASMGLPEFPYLAERGNIGLYLPKGTWLSGMQPMMIDEFEAPIEGP